LLSSVLGTKDNTGDNNVIVEVYGDVVADCPDSEYPHIPLITDPPTGSEQMKIGHSVTMLQQDYSDDKTLFTTLHDTKEVEMLKQRLTELQTDLETVLTEGLNKSYEEFSGPATEQ
jgi:hypothetical protein